MVENVTSVSVDLRWTEATDDATLPPDLEYRVCYSDMPDIGTAPEALANGIVARDWATYSAPPTIITGLIPATPYFVNVLVRDGHGNMAAYMMEPVMTTP